jgi:hypothetical protein
MPSYTLAFSQADYGNYGNYCESSITVLELSSLK